MLKEVIVPELGEGIKSAQITSVMVSEGSTVQKGQAVVEVESDKATLEIPSEIAGIIQQIHIKNGQNIQSGHVLLTIEVGEDLSPLPSEKKENVGELPEITGDDRASPSEEESQELPLYPNVPNDLNQKASVPAIPFQRQSPSITSPSRPPIPASPSVRRLARELGIDIYDVVGSGPDKRICIQDVKDHIKRHMEASPSPSSSGFPKRFTNLPDFSAFGPFRREKMSHIRQKTAEKMHFSWLEIPHVTQFDDADITALESFRQRKNKGLKSKGIKITVTAIFLKITALALRQFPQFNSSVDMQKNEIVYRDYVHLGVAVNTPRGLLVPVIRDVDKKDILTIVWELDDLARRARDKKIRPEELQASCFTLSNLGGLGTTYFTPIINWPEAAILGLGRAKLQGVLEHAVLQQRLLLPLSLSYDHRLLDGADAAIFCVG